MPTAGSSCSARSIRAWPRTRYAGGSAGRCARRRRSRSSSPRAPRNCACSARCSTRAADFSELENHGPQMNPDNDNRNGPRMNADERGFLQARAVTLSRRRRVWARGEGRPGPPRAQTLRSLHSLRVTIVRDRSVWGRRFPASSAATRRSCPRSSAFIRGCFFAAAVLALAAPAAAQQREPVLRQVKVPHGYYWREMYVPQATSGAGAAAWSPDGREVVYAMQGTLWRQRVDADSAEQLTDGPGYDSQPDWSPDGRLVVYASYRDDAVELRLLDLASGRDTALVAN